MQIWAWRNLALVTVMESRVFHVRVFQETSSTSFFFFFPDTVRQETSPLVQGKVSHKILCNGEIIVIFIFIQKFFF